MRVELPGGAGSYLTGRDVTGPVDAVLFFHGAGGDGEDFSHGKWEDVRSHLIDAGFVVVEADGCGRNWGGQCGRDAYRRMFQAVDANLTLRAVHILGRSMGGLPATYAATLDPVISSRVDKVALVAAVLDVHDAYATPQPDRQRSMDEALGDVSVAYDPMATDPQRWAGREVRLYFGTADVAVAHERNALAFADRIDGHADVSTVDLGPVDHSATYGIGADLVAFLTAR